MTDPIPSDDQLSAEQRAEVRRQADLARAAEVEEDRRTEAQPADDDA